MLTKQRTYASSFFLLTKAYSSSTFSLLPTTVHKRVEKTTLKSHILQDEKNEPDPNFLLPDINLQSNYASSESGKSLLVISPIIENVTVDIEVIYRQKATDLEEFKLTRNSIISILNDLKDTDQLGGCINKLVNELLLSCALNQNAILAVQIFHLVKSVSDYLSKQKKKSFDIRINWSNVYSYCLESVLDTLSKVYLEIVSGMSTHCRLLEVRYPDPFLDEYSAIDNTNPSFITNCINTLVNRKDNINDSHSFTAYYRPLSDDTFTISCMKVIQMMFYIRSKAFHDNISLLISFYERLMDNFCLRKVAPAVIECLVHALEPELKNPTLMISIRRKAFHYFASLRSSRMYYSLRETESAESERIFSDIPSMIMVILNLLFRSSNPTNYLHSIKGGDILDSIALEICNKKVRADFSLAKKFYQKILDKFHPSMLQFSLEKDTQMIYNIKTRQLKNYQATQYDFLQLLQHSFACGLLVHGAQSESFMILKNLWEPHSRGEVKSLSILRCGFIEDIFNICFEFSFDYDQTFLPILKILGLSMNDIYGTSNNLLWESLFKIRPSAIIPLFYYLVSNTKKDTKNIGFIFHSWKQWIEKLFDKFLTGQTAVFIPWASDHHNFNGTVFLEVSKTDSKFYSLTMKDFLWTPFLLELILPVMTHYISNTPLVLYHPYYTCLKTNNPLPISCTPFSELYFGSSLYSHSDHSFKPSAHVIRSISLFISKELHASKNPIIWESIFACDLSQTKICLTDIFPKKIDLHPQKSSIQFHSFIKLLDNLSLSSLSLLSSKRSFEIFSSLLDHLSQDNSLLDFSHLQRNAIALFAQSKSKSLVDSVATLNFNKCKVVDPENAFKIVVFFSSISDLKSNSQNLLDFFPIPALDNGSILMFMKALAISNHWYMFFYLLKKFIPIIPYKVKGILWNLQEKFTSEVTQTRSVIFFPQLKLCICGLPGFSVSTRIYGDIEPLSVVVDDLITHLSSYDLLNFNKFQFYELLCEIFKSRFQVKCVYQIRYNFSWDEFETILNSELDLSSFSPHYHAELDFDSLSKKDIIKDAIIDPLKSMVCLTDTIKFLSVLVNQYF